MRRLRFVVPVVAIAAASLSAVVVSAGPGGAGAGTIGYTVYLTPTIAGTDADGAEATVDPTRPDIPGLDVGVQQGSCLGRLATVDLASGAVTPLPAPASNVACASDLAFAPDGTLYGLVQSQDVSGPVAELVRYDLTSGAATPVGTFGPFQHSIGGGGELPLGGITFDGSGTLYALLGHANSPGFDPDCAPESTEFVNYCLYRVDDTANPGASTLVGVSTTEGVFGSVLASSCEAVYAGTFANDSDFGNVSTVNTATGGLTQIGTLSELRFWLGADFDDIDTFWSLVVTAESPFPIDVATIDAAGGSPIETLGPAVTAPDEEFFVLGLAVEPLDCTPEPIVLEPTFTG